MLNEHMLDRLVEESAVHKQGPELGRRASWNGLNFQQIIRTEEGKVYLARHFN